VQTRRDLRIETEIGSMPRRTLSLLAAILGLAALAASALAASLKYDLFYLAVGSEY
jgi:hypothetical protein